MTPRRSGVHREGLEIAPKTCRDPRLQCLLYQTSGTTSHALLISISVGFPGTDQFESSPIVIRVPVLLQEAWIATATVVIVVVGLVHIVLAHQRRNELPLDIVFGIVGASGRSSERDR